MGAGFTRHDQRKPKDRSKYPEDQWAMFKCQLTSLNSRLSANCHKSTSCDVPTTLNSWFIGRSLYLLSKMSPAKWYLNETWSPVRETYAMYAVSLVSNKRLCFDIAETKARWGALSSNPSEIFPKGINSRWHLCLQVWHKVLLWVRQVTRDRSTLNHKQGFDIHHRLS